MNNNKERNEMRYLISMDEKEFADFSMKCGVGASLYVTELGKKRELETDKVKLIRKTIKKLEYPTITNIAREVGMNRITLKKYLDRYEHIKWIGSPHKQRIGKPTTIYKNIKKVKK